MATSGLYGNSTTFGGTYFEWTVFQDSATQPATPTDGSWNFVTNVGTPPTGWLNSPPVNPVNKVWLTIALVNSKSTSSLTWSTPGLVSSSSGSSGSVTSVGLSAPSFLSVTNSPITSAGTLALSYSSTPLPIANGGTGTSTPSLIGGSNVSITGDWPNQTITATGGGGGGGMVYPPSGIPLSTGVAWGTSYGTTGANSIVLRDANQNITINALNEGFTSVAASGTAITLTASSNRRYTITGSGGQVIKLPNATTLQAGNVFYFDNNQSSGAITVNNNSNTLVVSVPSGGYVSIYLLDNSIAAGSWDRHDAPPSNVSWSTNTFNYPGTITGATWNGNAIPVLYGGTGTSTPSLVAGSNVSITGTWPNQTINSTNSGGTVTSVAATVPSFLSVSGSPITTSGTLAITYSSTALPVANGGTGTSTPSLVAGTNVTITGTWPNQTINSTASGGGGGTVTSVGGTGSVNGITLSGTVTSSGNLTLGGTLGGISNAQLTNSSVTINGNSVNLGGSTTVTANTTNALTIGTGLSGSSGSSYNGSSALTITNSGVLSFAGGTTGLTPATASTGAITLGGTLAIANGGTNGTASPTAGGIAYGNGTAYAFSVAGTSGQVLTSNGAGAPTWSTISGTGTVTSVGVSGGTTGLTTSGGPITGSGTITLSGTLGVANGGTGATSLTGLVVGNGTGAMTTVTAPTGTVVGTSDTQTLTNKWLQPRVNATTANTATYSINTDSYDMVVITGQTNAITSIATTGTPVNGQKLIVSITSTNTAIAFSATNFESSGTVTLPTSVTSSVRLDVGFIWNVATSKWRCVATA